MPDISEEISQVAEAAIAAFRKRSNDSLDYSEKSLEIVEEMLDEAARYFADMESTQQDGLVRYMSCYILEVARRAYGGKFYWHDGREKPVLVVGEPRFRLALLPWDRVRSRLNGDAADNIPFYYAGFREWADRATLGDDALYV